MTVMMLMLRLRVNPKKMMTIMMMLLLLMMLMMMTDADAHADADATANAHATLSATGNAINTPKAHMTARTRVRYTVTPSNTALHLKRQVCLGTPPHSDHRRCNIRRNDLQKNQIHVGADQRTISAGLEF